MNYEIHFKARVILTPTHQIFFIFLYNLRSCEKSDRNNKNEFVRRIMCENKRLINIRLRSS